MLKKIKITGGCDKRNMSLNLLTYNLTCVFDIHVHIDQVCPGIEPALLYSAAGLKQSALNIPPRRHLYLKQLKIYIQTM